MQEMIAKNEIAGAVTLVVDSILNFGMLDLHFQDFLESSLPPEEFIQIKGRLFYERADAVRSHAKQAKYDEGTKAAFAELFRRLGPLRRPRNHFAHGTSRIGLVPGGTAYVRTLFRLGDLDGADSSVVRFLSFNELLAASKALVESIESFQRPVGFKSDSQSKTGD